MDSNVPPSNPPPPGSRPEGPPPLGQPSGPPPLMAPRYLPPPRRSNAWKVIALVLLVLLLVSLFSNLSSLLTGKGPITRKAGPPLEEIVLEYNHSQNKIVVISVEGIIGDMGGGGYSMVEYIRDQFERAEKRNDVKAVILRINSPGGEVLASDQIHDIISEFQKNSKKPVVAAMSSLAASGGYYVAAPCQWIVADEMTITGSIGVIMSTFNVRGLLDKVGVQPHVFKSGRYKDMLGMTRKEADIPPEERKLVQDLIDETFVKFKNIVADGRQQSNKLNKDKESGGQPLASDWEQYADGRIFSGEQAYKYGFVDELGNWERAKGRALKLAGLDDDDANFIEYRQQFGLGDIFRILGKTEKNTVKIDLGITAPQVKPGYLYFLSPTYLQ